MPRIGSSDGTLINYEVAGDGSATVLLAHGLAMGAVRWEETGYVSRLGENFRVITVDLRGHGRSGRPHGAAWYSAELLVADVLAVLDAESVRTAQYWGYSLGARLGRHLLATAPERFTRAILGGYAPAPVSPDQVALIRLLREQGIEGFVNAMGPSLTPAAREFFLTNDAEALASIAETSSAWPEPEGLPPHPVLMYAGESASEFNGARAFAAELPQGSFVAIPEANHGMAFALSSLILDRAVEFLLRE